ncbi:hypothetical protein OpiT1DRAFT_00939 [Opitutaceae bacterium TAV1]|nr:hypothetical protein OpiT1DRAFT_00939 [Opitutaceae bacterium TAV1]
MPPDDAPALRIDGYGWPQGESSRTAAEEDARIASSLLDPIELRELQLTHLATGQEHAVYSSTLKKFADKVIKITRPGGYGIIMEAKPGADVIGWRRAGIREYLQRVIRQNRVFADNIEILGWIRQKNENGALSMCLVTAQKFRAGTPPGQEEIQDYMKSLGFSRVPPAMITLDYLKAHSFYAGSHNLLVSDCRSANFVKADDGLAVIDVIVQRPTGHLRQLLRECLGLRLDGAQIKQQLDQLVRSTPAGRERAKQAVRLVEDLGGPTPSLTALRIAAVRYARGESCHDLDACLEAHAEAASIPRH